MRWPEAEVQGDSLFVTIRQDRRISPANQAAQKRRGEGLLPNNGDKYLSTLLFAE